MPIKWGIRTLSAPGHVKSGLYRALRGVIPSDFNRIGRGIRPQDGLPSLLSRKGAWALMNRPNEYRITVNLPVDITVRAASLAQARSQVAAGEHYEDIYSALQSQWWDPCVVVAVPVEADPHETTLWEVVGCYPHGTCPHVEWTEAPAFWTAEQVQNRMVEEAAARHDLSTAAMLKTARYVPLSVYEARHATTHVVEVLSTTESTQSGWESR